jgi:hypothetical protein
MASIRNAFRDRLLSIAELKPIIGQRVYHKKIPADAGKDPYPCLVFIIVGGTTSKDLQGSAGLRRFDIEVVAEAYTSAELETIADALGTIEGRDPSGKLKWVWQDSEREEYDPPASLQTQVPHSSIVQFVVWI